MSNLLNIDAFSPLKGFLDDETSSEEDIQEDYVQFGDLYDYIGAPNPLPEEKKPSASDVRTAYNLNFTKLPEELYTASTSELDSTKANVTEEVTLSLDNLRKIDTDDNKAKQTTLVIPDSLFSLYPRNDPKLVYQKYKDQGDWEMKTKFYASYLVNIGNLVNNSQGKLQYRGNEDETRDMRTTQLNSSLQFDSRFESGNLFAAYKVSEFEYDLILQNDINSKGHTQWFFFSVSNMVKGRTIKFNIVNLLKPESLFNEGMKPAVFSTYDNMMNGEGWKRAGFNLAYSRNNINKEGLFNKSYYTLTFSYTFSHSNDTVYFAHSFPYTYSNLKTYLTNLCENPAKKMYIVRRTLCMTLGKNECEYLSITSPSDLENIERRGGIIISARQHPGESLSSFMMEGFLDFITSDEPEAVVLRNHCVFKVIPMLNPDGVIHGNYRTSLCGRDLNRIWNKPNPTLHPTIYHTKELIRKMESRRKLRLICDLHGHSRKKNAFFYGNATDDNPYNARVFPMIMSKLSKFVSFEDSRFVIQRSKEKTARVALWKQLRIDNVFTLEASFYGYTQENGTVKNFTKDDYRELGADLARALYVYLRDVTFDVPNPLQFVVPTSEDLRDASAERIKKYQSDRSSKKNRRSLSTSNPTGLSNSAMKVKQTLQEKRGSPTKPGKPETKINCTRLIEEMKNNKQLIAIGNNAEDSGSDTDNSEDDIADKELKKVLPVKMVGKTKKKKNKQSKKKTTIVVSKKDEKKTDDKDKKPAPAKVDSSTNTVAVQQVQSDKTIEQQSSAKKFKMPLRKIIREPLIKGRVFVAEPVQEQQAGVEMVSIGIQTEDTGNYRYESQDTSLERQLGQINKSVGLFADTRGWSQPNLSHNQKLGNPSIPPGKLFVVGEKAGIDGNGGVDYFYKLGKNQISRSVLARIQPKTVGSEVRQLQADQKRKSESVSSENLQNPKKQKIIISKMDKNEVKSSSTANSLHYYLYYKDAEPKSNTITAESYVQNSNMISDRLEDSKFRFKIESNKTPVKDFREAPEIKKSLSLKNLENKEVASEGQTPVPNSSSQLKLARLNIKEKPLIPLPRLLRNPANTRPESKEPLTTDLSGLMNNSIRRMGSMEEDASLYKTKLNRLPSQNMTASSFVGSYRDSFTEKMDPKREKLPLGLIKEYSGLTNRFLDSPSVQTPKAQEKTGSKEKTTKLERVLSSDVKFDIDRKAVEFDTFTAKGKRPQNSMLRKI